MTSHLKPKFRSQNETSRLRERMGQHRIMTAETQKNEQRHPALPKKTASPWHTSFFLKTTQVRHGCKFQHLVRNFQKLKIKRSQHQFHPHFFFAKINFAFTRANGTSTRTGTQTT